MNQARYLLASILLLASVAQAQQMYVTDELVITLRTGPSTQNTIVTNLRTGDVVEVLEVDDEVGYARVRLEDGDEGWVLTRYLMDEPSSDQQLATAERALSQARDRIAALESELSQRGSNLDETTAALDAAQSAHQSVSAELEQLREASSSVIQMQNDNDNLRRSNLELSSRVDVLVTETSRLGNRNRQNWFVVGALVLTFGIVIGLVAPSLRPRRRSNW